MRLNTYIFVPRHRTKLRNGNYNATPNPRYVLYKFVVRWFFLLHSQLQGFFKAVKVLVVNYKVIEVQSHFVVLKSYMRF